MNDQSGIIKVHGGERPPHELQASERFGVCECNQEATVIGVNPLLESTVNALNAISPQNQELVAILVRQLAEREGINMAVSPSTGLQTPAEGVPLWIAKLKQEGYSKETIRTYMSTINGYLVLDPTPSKLSIQQWLADRLEKVSSSRVASDRKALRSLFSFLHQEGLWAIDPTTGIKSIRVRYRARDLPEAESIGKLLQYDCHRPKDTPKFRLMTLILATTGLRITEACSIVKKSINIGKLEIMVVGKGDKEGIVPLLPMVAGEIQRYTDGSSNGSPYLFPGDTNRGYYSISSYEKTLARACAKLEIERITPHQLRHFFATFALRGGAKLEVVSKILRHASVGITADIYRHVMTDEMHEEAGKFAPLANAPLSIPETTAIEVEKEIDVTT